MINPGGIAPRVLSYRSEIEDFIEEGLPMVFKWIQINFEQGECKTKRAKVIGGWLVKVHTFECEAPGHTCLSFVPDPKHTWKVER